LKERPLVEAARQFRATEQEHRSQFRSEKHLAASPASALQCSRDSRLITVMPSLYHNQFRGVSLAATGAGGFAFRKPSTRVGSGMPGRARWKRTRASS